MSDDTIDIQPRQEKKKTLGKTKAEDEVDDLIVQSEISDAKRKLQKKYIKWGIWASIGGLLIWLVYFLFAPYKGGMDFGICKVFLERSVQYPSHLRLSYIENFGSSVRIWYTQIDSFGEYRLEPIQCYYRADEKMGAVLDKVTVRRRELDPQVIASFNKTIPAILENPPDLTIPSPLPYSLKDLKIETDLFRKFRLPEYMGRKDATQ